MNRDFFAKALELQRRRQPFATATVVRVDRPTSGQPGDKAIITLDGELEGWIGGSCARPMVLQEAAAALRDDRARLVRLSSDPESKTDREGMTDLSMTCFSGGTMEIYIEPHQPQPQLVIVGDLPVSQALAELGRALRYSIVSVEIEHVCGALEAADQTVTGLEGIEAIMSPLTYVVVATHGDHDEVAVARALESGAGYVGLVASPKRSESILGYLQTKGFSADLLARVEGPAGIDIQARLPEEIALSILARIIQHRRNTEAIDWSATGSGAETLRDGQGEPAAETAIDPVCGMSVKLLGATNVYTYEGTDFYFCCSGCLAGFTAEPDRYLQMNS